MWGSRTHTSRRIDGISGASVPVWSRNGSDLLFVKQDALWLVVVAGGSPVEVAGPSIPRRSGRARTSLTVIRSGSATTARSPGCSSSTGGRLDPGGGRSTRQKRWICVGRGAKREP